MLWTKLACPLKRTTCIASVESSAFAPQHGSYWSNTVYAIYFAGVLFLRISRVGCYSQIQQHAKINLPPIPMQECDLCNTYAILVVKYTVHVQMSEWYWFLRPPSMSALLLDHKFNHSRKCLEVPNREKYGVYSSWPNWPNSHLFSLWWNASGPHLRQVYTIQIVPKKW